jgi:hypothetical protein
VRCLALGWVHVLAKVRSLVTTSALLTGTYDQGEIAYMWLSLFAKGVLGLLVLFNVLMLGSFTEIYES